MPDNKLYIKRGLLLGLGLALTHKIFFGLITPDNIHNSSCIYAVAITFCIVVFLSLISRKISALFITGFTGLFTLIGVEFVLAFIGFGSIMFDDSLVWFEIYLYGFIGSMLGTAAAFLFILINISSKEGDCSMEKSARIKLLIYALVSALSFTYLILPERAGVSVPIFVLLQWFSLWFVVPDRKRLWLLIPVFILSLNSFISGNTMWRVPNVIICVVLYSVMFLDYDVKDTSARLLLNILRKITAPINHYRLPFKWVLDTNKGNAPVIKRVLIALAITLPCLIVLIITLSNTDMIFSKGVYEVFSAIFKYININVVFKTLYGFAVGIYLFGLIYSSYCKKAEEHSEVCEKHGDLIVLNILLASILSVYTIFVVIQFKYLFAGAALPYGLTYTEYARKGFFELFALTGVNIAAILVTVHLTKTTRGIWVRVTKWLCYYLCAITIVLLTSSFYRMWLYNADAGLTRLRFLVFGFLIFEALGLLLTFFYIFKPKFNMITVYLLISLTYYLLLNIVPIDYFVAKSQVDRYLSTGKADIYYTLTLSTDAAPQIERILSKANSFDTFSDISYAKSYFEKQIKYNSNLPSRWQRYNLSMERALRIAERISPSAY